MAKSPAAAPDLDDLSFRPVTEETWPAFEAFFSEPGGPKHCWCMVWRRTSEEGKLQAGADRKRMLHERIADGNPVGLLAYRGGRAVGWVSIAPRSTYRNLGGPEADSGEKIWSLVCFFVPRRLRGEGMVRGLLAGAIAYARREGAAVVEAYPVDEDSPSFRFMGFVPVFREAGFTELGRPGTRRHVMRLKMK
jgi:GNAT superfamily N-acetyltransferase